MLNYIRKRLSFKYLVVTTGTIAVVFTLLFFWITRQQEKNILEQVEKQAVILYRQIVLTRQWVSDHNYILIAQKDDRGADYVIQNPQIEEVHGKVYTRITPAALTRRLSRYAAKSQLYSFNLTNIDGLNPNNRPDDFEAAAIAQFRTGGRESVSRIETHQGQPVFRYAAPLVIRESCLSCHTSYRVGGIGGCISVFIPFAEARAAIHRDRVLLLLAMVGLTGSVILVLFLLTRKIIFNPIKEIRTFTERLKAEAFEEAPEIEGDELREFAELCYLMDEKLGNQHEELERKISEATADLHRTNLELARVNRDLSRFNRAKAEFFTDISHELRTPLTAIKGAADILTRKGSCSDPEYLAIIQSNTEHLIRTIIDFLDYSKIESNRLELDIRDEPVSTVVADAVKAQQPVAQKKGLRFEIRSPETLTLPMDRHRIRQVLVNLISNAIRFSPENGTIFIDIVRQNGSVEIAVTDRGPGIPPAYHQAIFEKFYQAPGQPDRRKVNKGTSGIGLAICKGLVEAHGGGIRVESPNGGGSRFVFSLPLRAQHPVGNQPEAE